MDKVDLNIAVWMESVDELSGELWSTGVEEEWILDDSSRPWSADAGRYEYDDSIPCPWSTGVEEEWILENSSSLRSADAGRLEYDDSFPCPWSTGVEEEWILEDSSRSWLADAGT